MRNHLIFVGNNGIEIAFFSVSHGNWLNFRLYFLYLNHLLIAISV